MKKISILLIGLLMSLAVNAIVTKTIYIMPSGTLKSSLTPTELTTITNLTITGNIDARDFKTMRDDMISLDTINLISTSIVAYTGTEGTINSTSQTYNINVIPENAFLSKSKLISLKLPSTAKSIGNSAFKGCTSLVTMNIPTSVTFISSYIFDGCTSLESVVIPNSVTYLGTYTFNNCTSLTTVSFPKTLSNISSYTFNNCTSLTTFSIPSTVTNIASYAFYKSGLTTLNIPDNVKTIGRYSFSECTNLLSVSISPLITSIGSYAFSGCTKLNYASTPYGSDWVVERMFENCPNLKTIEVPVGVINLVDDAFNGLDCNTVSLPNTLTSIGNRAFLGNLNFTSLPTLPNTITSIGDMAFKYCRNIKSLSFPISLTHIGSEAFCVNRGLTAIFINKEIVDIGVNAFAICTGSIIVDENNPNYSSLDSVLFNKSKTTLIQASISKTGIYTIPNEVRTLGIKSFWYCDQLNSIIIPNTVTTINSSAFQDCTSLKSIKVESILPIDLSNSINVFSGVDKSNCKLIVPNGSLNAYKTAVQWQDFLNIEEEYPTGITLNNLNNANYTITDNTITLNNINIGVSIKVLDLNGKSVYSQISKTENLNIVLPKRGVYVLCIGKKNSKIIF